MPCAAPCDRLPCDERCNLKLTRGHRCPGFCGETCPDRKFCQVCGGMGGERVDFTEMKTYGEVDLDDTPVVVLTCGHLYTGENLDMLVNMGDVYTVDSKGEYSGLKDITAALAKEVPLCPDCRRPIRQFSTKRYNRVVDKAVMDETSKRFLALGRRRLEELEGRLKIVEEASASVKHSPWMADRYSKWFHLEKDARSLIANMGVEHQPAKRLHDAKTTRHRQDPAPSLAEQTQRLHLTSPSTLDTPVTLKARLVHIPIREVHQRDMLDRNKDAESARPARSRISQVWLKDCASLSSDAKAAALPRIEVAAILAYSRLFMLLRRKSPLQAGDAEEESSMPWGSEELGEKLEYARSLCVGLPGGDDMRAAVDAMKRLVESARYEEVTSEEVEAIKAAMVSGCAGLATNSGHWYNCANGHPVSGTIKRKTRLVSVFDLNANGMQFAIGEWGMPMELARCPECGARIGGANHNLVEGTTRAMEME